jgi:hypothetical protein
LLEPCPQRGASECWESGWMVMDGAGWAESSGLDWANEGGSCAFPIGPQVSRSNFSFLRMAASMFVCLEADQAALKFRLVCRGAGEGGGGSTSFVAGVAQLSNFYLHLAKSTGRVEPHQRALRSLASRRVCSRFGMMTRTSSFSPIAEHRCQPLQSIPQ